MPEDGLYEIAIKAKQNLSRGTFSNRRVWIDGRLPFDELEAIPFNYSSRYQMKRLGVDTHDEPFLFYLTKGKHTIRLEAVLGDLAALVERSEEVLYELNSIYRSIIMITSATPDPMRSYQLEIRVPNLLNRLAQQSAIVKEMAEELRRITGERGGHTATLIDLARHAGPHGGPARLHPQLAPGVSGRHRQLRHVDHQHAPTTAPDRLFGHCLARSAIFPWRGRPFSKP